MSRVLLAMSGGVDSSTAAWLLREEGHEVIGVFMRHGQQPATACASDATSKGDRPIFVERKSGQSPSHKQGCCSASDAADARRVAERLAIPFYALNFEQEFTRIIDYFVAEYTAGRTPNPCIVCNTWLKFGKLFAYADSIGADLVATGHYARLQTLADGQTALLRGRDPAKDQSYVLWGIQRRLLARLRFPVGEHTKDEVRQIARKLDLRVAEKPDSQEICFIPDQDHARFIAQRGGTPDTAGDIVTTEGTVVGQHDGVARFTVGQRKGLGIAFGEPRYVVRIEAPQRRVVLGTKEELARTELVAGGVNWLIDGSARATTMPAQVKIRYRSPAAEATVEALPGERFHVHFARPCYAVAPGQAAVCYQGDRVLGGGWIEG